MKSVHLTWAGQGQRGQSMIEYVVILGALTAALLAAGNGSIGLSKTDDQSLMQAMHERYTAQAYALSITELPEGRDLAELADYYNSLGKYPTLSSNLQDASTALGKVSQGISDVSDGIDKLEEYTDPKKALELLDTDTIKDEIQDSLEDAVQDALNPF